MNHQPSLAATSDPTPATPNAKRARNAMLAVFVVAFLLRAGWGVTRGLLAHDFAVLEFPDEQQYWQTAQSIHQDAGLRDEFGFRATRMPLYPAFLSLFCGLPHGVIFAKASHWVMGASVAALALNLAGAIAGPRVAILAGLLVAFDPFLVLTSSLLLTETPFLVAVLLLWRVAWSFVKRVDTGSPTRARANGGGAEGWEWRRFLLLGALASLAVYLRESGLGLFIVLMAFVILCRRCDRRVLAGLALSIGIVVLSLVPWAARNQTVTGEWCWLTHRAGISLFDGVGPQADGSSDLADLQQMPAVVGLTGAQWNQYFLSESFRSIRNDPGRLVRLAWVKIKRMWNPLPNVDTYQSRGARFVAGAWSIPIFALALAGMLLRSKMAGGVGWRAKAFLLLPAVYLTMLHCVFVGSIRYRLTAMPMLEILAAVALAAIARRRHQEKPTAVPGAVRAS